MGNRVFLRKSVTTKSPVPTSTNSYKILFLLYLIGQSCFFLTAYTDKLDFFTIINNNKTRIYIHSFFIRITFLGRESDPYI